MILQFNCNCKKGYSYSELKPRSQILRNHGGGGGRRVRPGLGCRKGFYRRIYFRSNFFRYTFAIVYLQKYFIVRSFPKTTSCRKTIYGWIFSNFILQLRLLQNCCLQMKFGLCTICGQLFCGYGFCRRTSCRNTIYGWIITYSILQLLFLQNYCLQIKFYRCDIFRWNNCR